MPARWGGTAARETGRITSCSFSSAVLAMAQNSWSAFLPCQQIRTSWTEPLSSRGSKGSHSYPCSSRLPCGYCLVHLTLDYHTLFYHLWPRYHMFYLSTMRLMAMPHLVHIHQCETAWGLQCPECRSSPDNVKRAPKHFPPNVVSLSSLPSQIDGSRLLHWETPARIVGSSRSSFHLLTWLINGFCVLNDFFCLTGTLQIWVWQRGLVAILNETEEKLNELNKNVSLDALLKCHLSSRLGGFASISRNSEGTQKAKYLSRILSLDHHSFIPLLHLPLPQTLSLLIRTQEMP